MDVSCERCGKPIPKRRLENARRVGVVPKYHSDRCQNAAKQERFRKQVPRTAQDKIHLRNLVAHGMIAEKILRDPTVIENARENLSRWFGNDGETPAHREWQAILASGNALVIVATLLRVDEEGMRLRSSSPFAGALSDLERSLIFDRA